MLNEETDINNQLNLIRGIVNIPLSNHSIELLLEILDFTERSATVLCDLELSNGNMANAKKMREYGDAAITLSDIVHKHLMIGQPENDTMN